MPRTDARTGPARQPRAVAKPAARDLADGTPAARARAASRPAPRTRAASSAAERRRLTQELRALAHPLRLKLLEMFAGEPRTTMQVAALMGEPPTRLYHHVNALERAGILRLERTRQVRGTTEKYFEVAKKQIGIARPAQVTRSSRAAFRGLATLVVDEARAELVAALAKPSLLSKTTAPIAFRMLLAVPPSHQTRVRKRIMATIEAIKRELKDCDKRSAPRWAMTLVFAPRISRKRSD